MISNCKVCFVVRKPYDPVVIRPAPRGDEVEKEYRLVRDSHGNCEYIEVGEKNIREYIESFKNGCSLKSILDRCQLMPIRDKVAYLNQTDVGVSADMTNMPKDGTEAQIMIAKVKAACPDFCKRMKEGESFEKILAELINVPKASESVSDSKPVESEVNTNG